MPINIVRRAALYDRTHFPLLSYLLRDDSLRLRLRSFLRAKGAEGRWQRTGRGGGGEGIGERGAVRENNAKGKGAEGRGHTHITTY
eukprot:8388225-Heterocapsa_arctica.AAC.1